MLLDQLKQMFERALLHTFSKKKLVLFFPVVFLCGLLTVFCITVSSIGKWAEISFSYLPIFGSFGLLLSSGILLNRIYFKEIKGLSFNYIDLMKESMTVIVQSGYIFAILLGAYFLLGMGLEFFYLLKFLPGIGPMLTSLLSFIPFLVMLAIALASIATVLFLFFVTPILSLRQQPLTLKGAQETLKSLKKDIFTNLILFLVGIAPFLLLISLLSMSVSFTTDLFFTGSSFIGKFFRLFFIMIPCAVLLMPAIIFFFNFSTESFGLMQKRVKIK